MKYSVFFPAFLAVLLGLGGQAARAQDDGPRQLGAPPTLPPPPRPRATPAPRQLDAVPVAPPDTTRRATVTSPQPGPLGAPAPVYAPTPAGQLPGGNTGRPTRFQVGLKNGMLYNAGDVEVKTPLFGRSFLLLDGRRRFELAEVGFYEDESGHYVRTTLPGANRESTLRRDKIGRISLYSITTSQYSSTPGGLGYGGYGYGYGGYGMGGMGGYPYGGYRTVKTEYFSKDNGPIQNLSTQNLLLATADNAGAQQLLIESRRYQQATVASYVVGGGLLVAGLLQTLRPGDGGNRISPLLYAALPVLIVPVVLQGKQAANQRQAISLYNAER